MWLARDNSDTLRASAFSVDSNCGDSPLKDLSPVVAVTENVTSIPSVVLDDPPLNLFRTLTEEANSVPKLTFGRGNLTRSKSLEVGYFFDVKFYGP